jgi:hypothetical protein
MIYLIDDNQNNQRERLGKSFVDEGVFDGYLTSVEKLEKRAQASDISHLAFLKDAKCILLHASMEDYDSVNSTFLHDSFSNVRKIKEEIADYGDAVPFVLFSNGMSETDYRPDTHPHYISTINKNYLYTHLRDFVEHYKNTDEIELRILVWGKNFRANEISKLGKQLLENFALKEGADVLNSADISACQPTFNSFIEAAYPDKNASNILNEIATNQLTINVFRERINLITESFLKYGKNIRPWK